MNDTTQSSLRAFSPMWVSAGFICLICLAAYSLESVYEETILTWRGGPQMIGFTIAHVYPWFLIIGILAKIENGMADDPTPAAASVEKKKDEDGKGG